MMSILYTQGYVQLNNPDKSIFPIRGIDISHHQGQIDWSQLSQADLMFVYIKATEGGDFQDPMFKDNWHNVKKIGLIQGASHVYHLGSLYLPKLLIEKHFNIYAVKMSSNNYSLDKDVFPLYKGYYVK